MEEVLTSDKFSAKFTEGKDIINGSEVDKKVTEEEFQNFMHRVTEVEKIVKKLASSDPKEQKHGQMLADNILGNKDVAYISDSGVRVKVNRTLINKYSTNDQRNNEQMSQEAFMKSVEKDARERAEDRKYRNERAETLKRIGNGAFREGYYEKAVTFYTKALEQRKDSSVLWNNRALSYMYLGLYQKALADCEWALRVNDSNVKALLNSAKCYMHLGNENKYREYIEIARNKNPQLHKFINEFQRNIEHNARDTDDDLQGEKQAEH